MRGKIRVPGRSILRRGVMLGLLAGAATAAVRFGPTLLRKRSERRDREIAAATDALWPPVPTKSDQGTNVNAPLATTASDGGAIEDK